MPNPMTPIKSSGAESFAYFGDREGWLRCLGQHRDSDALERSNFRVALQLLERGVKESEEIHVEGVEPWVYESGGWVREFWPTYEHTLSLPSRSDEVEYDDGEGDFAVERFSNWLVGWSEVILVRPGSEAEKTANWIREKLEDYPVLDEDDWSQEEQAEQDEDWDHWGREDFKGAVSAKWWDIIERQEFYFAQGSEVVDPISSEDSEFWDNLTDEQVDTIFGELLRTDVCFWEPDGDGFSIRHFDDAVLTTTPAYVARVLHPVDPSLQPPLFDTSAC